MQRVDEMTLLNGADSVMEYMSDDPKRIPCGLSTPSLEQDSQCGGLRINGNS